MRFAARLSFVFSTIYGVEGRTELCTKKHVHEEEVRFGHVLHQKASRRSVWPKAIMAVIVREDIEALRDEVLILAPQGEYCILAHIRF